MVKKNQEKFLKFNNEVYRYEKPYLNRIIGVEKQLQFFITFLLLHEFLKYNNFSIFIFLKSISTLNIFFQIFIQNSNKFSLLFHLFLSTAQFSVIDRLFSLLAIQKKQATEQKYPQNFSFEQNQSKFKTKNHSRFSFNFSTKRGNDDDEKINIE